MDDRCSSGPLVLSSSAFGPSACRPPSVPPKGAQGALGEAVQLAGVPLPSPSTRFQATISSTPRSTPPSLTHLAAWLRENHEGCDSQVSRGGHPGFGCEAVGPPCSKQSVVLLSHASRPARAPGACRSATLSEGTRSWSDTGQAVPMGTDQFPGACCGLSGGQAGQLSCGKGDESSARPALALSLAEKQLRPCGAMLCCLLLRPCSRKCPSRQAVPCESQESFYSIREMLALC